jgi:hypothetical protein
VEEMVVWWGWWVGDLIMRWRWGDGVGLKMDMVESGFVSLLLLMKDIDSILQLCEPHPLSVDMLSASLGPLVCLPSHDGLLFLPKHLHLLLDSSQLFLLYCCFFFFGFFVPIMDLDLIRLRLSWDYLCSQRCSQG